MSESNNSFGNNFNNRTEEAMGSTLDLWTAFREGAFSAETPPWLGYIFLLQDCAKSQTPVRVAEPHFSVFPEFQDASYARRYEIFFRKLKLERHYEAFLDELNTVWREVHRVLVPGGRLVCVVGDVCFICKTS